MHLLQGVSNAFLELEVDPLAPVVIPINLGNTNAKGKYQGSHWVGLVIRRNLGNDELEALYQDSFGTSMDNSLPTLRQILINHNINAANITDLSTVQQNNGYDCGLYTVLNLNFLQHL